MSQADLLARLEAVTARLEKAAARMGGGGGAGGDDDDETPGYVTELQGIITAQIPKVTKACTDVGLAPAGDLIKTAYDNVLDFVARVPKVKKPTPVCINVISSLHIFYYLYSIIYLLYLLYLLFCMFFETLCVIFTQF